MRKFNVIAMTAIASVALMMTACGNHKKTDTTKVASSESTKAGETVKISESESAKSDESTKAGETTKADDSKASSTVSTDGGHNAVGPAESSGAKAGAETTPADKAPDPNAAKQTIIAIYVPSDKGLKQKMDSVEALDAEHLNAKMVEQGVLAGTTAVKSFTMDGKKGTLELSELDTSKEATVASVIDTYIENFDLETLTIKVNGKDVVTDAAFRNTKTLK